MQLELDKTNIAIRERTMSEILDMSLHVARRYAKGLALALFLGAAPAALLAWFLLRDVAAQPLDDDWTYWRYTMDMAMLVFILQPLATAPVTLYLGQALFVERPSIRQMLDDARKVAGQLILYQSLPRGIVAALLLIWTVSPSPFQPFALGELFLIFLVIYLFILRGVRPFLTEIILLEKNPRKAKRGAMTTSRRMGTLHAGSGGDLFARGLGVAVVALLLLLAIGTSILMFREMLTGQPSDDRWALELYMPLTMWIVAGYFAVVRFLNYLDLRIRREGWEVELRMRAEAARLVKQLA